MRILVTGAEGFIGSHLVEELVARGHDVTAFVLYNSFGSAGWLDSLDIATRQKIDVVFGDVRDGTRVREVMRDHSRVAHLASLVAIPYSYVAPHSYFATNVLGTLNVMEACRDAGVERVVHTSTSEVYGSAQVVPMDESHPLVGQSPYSASKIAADQLAHSFWASFDVPVVTIRPFNAYGPRQSKRAFIPSTIGQLLAGLAEIRFGSLYPTRDLTFVSDTARGFADVLESSSGLGETFNMGSGFEVSMQEVFVKLCDIAGYQPEVLVDQDRLRPKESEVQRLYSNSGKIREAFGWQPRYAGVDGFRRGLEDTYAWFEQFLDTDANASHFVV